MSRLKVLMAGMAVLLLVGCADFLTVEPRDELSRADLFSDLRGAEAATIGLYHQLGQGNYYQSRMPIYADVQGNMQALDGERTVDFSDISGLRRQYITLYAFNVKPTYDLAKFDELYNQAYTTLYQANDLIDGLPTLTDAPAEHVASLVAEARAVRALVHFDLARLFAQAPGFSAGAAHPGIVLVMAPPKVGDTPARSTVAEVYRAIRADLEAAEAEIQDRFSVRSAEPYWLSKTVIRGLLARVSAYERDWVGTFEWANRSLSDQGSSLTSRGSYVAEWNRGRLEETLWELDLQRLTEVGGTANITSAGNVVGVGNVDPYLQVSTELISLIGEDDLRRQLIVKVGDAPQATVKHPFVRNFIRNPILLRRSDLVLLRAEAAVELGRLEQALADLSLIAQRADPRTTPPGLDAADLRTAIRRERRKELAFEGHHFFDLGRWGAPLERGECASFVQVCQLSYPDYRYILPIPYNAIQRNSGLKQNDGY